MSSEYFDNVFWSFFWKFFKLNKKEAGSTPATDAIQFIEAVNFHSLVFFMKGDRHGAKKLLNEPDPAGLIER